MKTIVVSGINLFTGGTLKVMQECISALSSFAGDEYEIVALVHNAKQYAFYPNVRYIAFPKSRQSYLYRLYYEYIGFRKLSKQLKPYAWLSMHDTTPNVIAEKRMVYCHNPFPFYKAGWRDFILQRNIFFFSILSKYTYQINIKKNEYVIVQQEWMRKTFREMFAIDNIVVSIPMPPDSAKKKTEIKQINSEKEKITFFFPATPMTHKNFELLCEAAALLEKDNNFGFAVLITVKGMENKYAKRLYEKYQSLKSLRFIGFLNREKMDFYYQTADCMVFPSKAETWGLPLTEAKEYDKPILASNLPFAKETVGKYDKVKFFDPDDVQQLADAMKNFMQGTIVYDETKEVEYNEPVARNWDELVQFLFAE
ncbi:MAG: glycosyltransferase family 4 protein [Candidatus Azobacteroides sp.]|nr:glycosyltransferase family 4 protein [Candidatus Azobacteroides sp.]